MVHKLDQAWIDVLDEAEQWVVRMRSDRLTLQDQEHFSQWLAQSFLHRQAFDHVVDTLQMSGVVQYLPEYSPDKNLKQVRRSKRLKDLANSSAMFWRSGWVFSCFVAMLLVLLLYVYPTESEQHIAYFKTTAGQQRSIDLPDGSHIKLNTQSELRVEYKKSKRLLRLLAGEAWFDVQPDNERPFIVRVGAGEVIAVGTSFNIYRQDTTTRVVVTSGVVDVVVEQGLPLSGRQQVQSDQQIDINPQGLGIVQHADQSSRALAWRHNKIIFDDVPLVAALTELNRYLATPVATTDPWLSDLTVSGTFSLESPLAILRAIGTSFGLELSKPEGSNSFHLFTKKHTDL